MIKRMVTMLAATGLVFGAIFGFQAFKARMIQQAMAALSNPPQTVSTVIAQKSQWQPRLEAVGSLRAVNGSNVSFQVSGIVSKIHFESGTDVEEGSPLIDLIATDDIAHLEALKATTELARTTLERDSRMVKIKAVSEQQGDIDLWTLKNDEAQVAQQQALVDYKFLKAPFAGRLGIRMVDLGQYLAAGTAIVTLQQLDPIYVDFFLPQQHLARIKVGLHVTATVDAYQGRNFDGQISALNSAIDTTTRNVQIRATLKNPDKVLLPGMFVRVFIDAGSPELYVTLPQTAVAHNSYGNIVYVVDAKDKPANGQSGLVARQTFVTTGPTRGDQVAVLSGINEHDTVVSAGQMKLRNGTPVTVDNTVRPTDDPAPNPVDQ
jgi:membrane fusion protein, multidrug efflux system